MKNKKAQEMSVTAIILIILGLVVLVILILGFSIGWGNIKNWIIPSNNVKVITDSCKIACGTDQKYSYCSEKRELKADKEKLVDVTCYSLAKKKPVYGIESCPAIECGIYDDLNKAKAECQRIDDAGNFVHEDQEAYEVSYINVDAGVETKKCSDIK